MTFIGWGVITVNYFKHTQCLSPEPWLCSVLGSHKWNRAVPVLWASLHKERDSAGELRARRIDTQLLKSFWAEGHMGKTILAFFKRIILRAGTSLVFLVFRFYIFFIRKSKSKKLFIIYWSHHTFIQYEAILAYLFSGSFLTSSYVRVCVCVYVCV